jgi:hypothetical protein
MNKRIAQGRLCVLCPHYIPNTERISIKSGIDDILSKVSHKYNFGSVCKVLSKIRLSQSLPFVLVYSVGSHIKC